MCIINQFFSRTSLPDTFLTPLLFYLVSYWSLWFSLGLYLERHHWRKRCQTHVPCQRAFELIYFCRTNGTELWVASLLKSSSDLFSQNKHKTAWEAAMSLNKSGSQVSPRCLALEAGCVESPEQDLPAQLPCKEQKLHFFTHVSLLLKAKHEARSLGFPCLNQTFRWIFRSPWSWNCVSASRCNACSEVNIELVTQRYKCGS